MEEGALKAKAREGAMYCRHHFVTALVTIIAGVIASTYA